MLVYFLSIGVVGKGRPRFDPLNSLAEGLHVVRLFEREINIWLDLCAAAGVRVVYLNATLSIGISSEMIRSVSGIEGLSGIEQGNILLQGQARHEGMLGMVSSWIGTSFVPRPVQGRSSCRWGGICWKVRAMRREDEQFRPS